MFDYVVGPLAKPKSSQYNIPILCTAQQLLDHTKFHFGFKKLCIVLVGDDSNTKFLVNHKCKDSHHCSTSVIEFNRPLRQLSRFVKCIPSEVKRFVTEVTNKFPSCDILHDKDL